MELKYQTTIHRQSISVEEYIEDYVNIPTFLECCKACQNYEKRWSCPPFDFDVIEYWKAHETLDVIGVKIIFDESMLQKTYTKEEINQIINDCLWKEKEKMTDTLMEEEKKYPGSVSLSAGSCLLCGDMPCSKEEGLPCRHPEKMRYSIEALGGDVGRTGSKLLGVDLEWMEEGKLPHHFLLVGGLLK